MEGGSKSERKVGRRVGGRWVEGQEGGGSKGRREAGRRTGGRWVEGQEEGWSKSRRKVGRRAGRREVDGHEVEGSKGRWKGGRRLSRSMCGNRTRPADMSRFIVFDTKSPIDRSRISRIFFFKEKAEIRTFCLYF